MEVAILSGVILMRFDSRINEVECIAREVIRAVANFLLNVAAYIEHCHNCQAFGALVSSKNVLKLVALERLCHERDYKWSVASKFSPLFSQELPYFGCCILRQTKLDSSLTLRGFRQREPKLALDPIEIVSSTFQGGV